MMNAAAVDVNDNGIARAPSATKSDLSIVVPLYNEEDVLPRLIDRLKQLLSSMPLNGEIVFVDDGSRDATRQLVKRACAEDARFRLVSLSRNFGHQLAVSAGLAHSGAAAVAVIDGDLEDPPELVYEMYQQLVEGFDVVYAVRRKRKEGRLKRLAYWLFYRTLRKITRIYVPLDSGDFCVMSRRVVDHLNALPEKHRFVRGLRSWVGFRQTGFAYERAARGGGASKYSWANLIRLACDGIFTFSQAPLRLATYLGLLISVLSFAYAAFVIIWRLVSEQPMPGFATLAAGMFFLGGVQLFCLGILGEYVGRIHNEVKNRPPFIVDELVGFGDASSARSESSARSPERAPTVTEA